MWGLLAPASEVKQLASHWDHLLTELPFRGDFLSVKITVLVMTTVLTCVGGTAGGVVAPGTKVKRLSGKSDPPSVWSNLLVRIDSMLLSGAVTVEEARSLRRLVAARDVRAAEAFEDLSEWSDEELSKLLLNFTKGSDRCGQEENSPRLTRQFAPDCAACHDSFALPHWLTSTVLCPPF